ncbi:TPM domain-containing protein [Petroclostridium sp. X23]|uniref:TPM domain-containing protein n=1 Tax=Petroclostridium sp. X23 TaxID=3045146 RepID=UPI0024AC8D04|nr:TPM domain-containing protein [Petroclostridium sp. X23]WHH59969.1 TPM domain-containing protein [Petroclostridium sp. X23]
MKKLSASLLVVVLLILSIFTVANAQPVIPSPTGYFFNDFAGVTSGEVRREIENTARELEEKTGAQIVVVIPQSLEEMAIDDYAYELFKAWKIGQKNKDNGVLLIVAPNERKSRIEVGRGLEGRLPDGKTGRIQDEHLLPFVKESNYDTGIKNTFITLANEVAAEYDVTLTGVQMNQPQGYRSTSKGGSKAIIIILAALVILDLIFNRGSITGFIIEMLLWNALLGGRRGGSGDGGFGGGGFYGGGGSSGGGGSDRDW